MIEPEKLAAHYARFRVSERLLLTGHSHQAWPDVGFEAQQRAWLDAAEHLDEKWERAEEQARLVREGWRRLLGDAEGDGEIALGQNTHELVTRFLSALPLADRPRLVTTDGEFHTVRRQLDRLAETGLVEVAKVGAHPVGTLAGRLAAAVDDRTAAVLVSSVLYATSEIVPGLREVAEACERHGTELLVDAYHHLNALPFDLRGMDLGGAFVTGGGYKYCQLGEGNCFLRFPADRPFRPVLTGWFAEFGDLAGGAHPEAVPYAAGPARFAGATYDPTAHYRAAAVFEFFVEHELTPRRLRELGRHQLGVLVDGLREGGGLERARPAVMEGDDTLGGIGGFLALRVDDAEGLQARLRARDLRTDHRGDLIRLGPAPYLTDGQLEEAAALVCEALAEG